MRTEGEDRWWRRRRRRLRPHVAVAMAVTLAAVALVVGCCGGQVAAGPPDTKDTEAVHKWLREGTDPPQFKLKTPLLWLHIPKCGSTFRVALMHFGCDEAAKQAEWNDKLLSSRMYMITHCNGDGTYGSGIVDKKDVERGYWNGHKALTVENVNKYTQRGSMVGLFRDPKERMISGLLHNLHDCQPLQRAVGVRELRLVTPASTAFYQHLSTNGTLREEILKTYHRCVRGLSVRKMCTLRSGLDQPFVPTTSACIANAMQNLDKFAYVGVTDDWDGSLALWKKLFGGTYLDTALLNTRPSPHGGLRDLLRQDYDRLKLVDTADKALFDRVRFYFDNGLSPSLSGRRPPQPIPTGARRKNRQRASRLT